MLKSDPQLYKMILGKEGLEPSECLFIDDMERFNLATKSLGLKTIQFENVEKLLIQMKKIGIEIE